MKAFLFRLLAKLTGKNSFFTPKAVIIDQMNEPRPLPMGRADFEDWSDRLISGALLPGGKEDPKVFIEGQKYALANMLLHLGPTESHKPDAFFIHSLRKVVTNQVAHTMIMEIKAAGDARAAARKAAEEAEAESDAPIALVKTTEEKSSTLN